MIYVKSPKIKLLLILFMVLIAFVTLIKGSITISDTNKNIPVAEHGVLDLRHWDFKKDGMVKLDG
ncbi:MAG: hypothetical protein RR128_10210, partial [Clostridium sp.]